MSLWIHLPESLDAGEASGSGGTRGRYSVSVPGQIFRGVDVETWQPSGLRISFAAMTPEEIRSGLAILGRIFQDELERAGRAYAPLVEAAALSLKPGVRADYRKLE